MGERVRRITELDGLRGAAALVVVIHHSLLTLPGFAAGYFHAIPTAWVEWVLTFTPLHLIWAGGEAVYVFFILSGFVLTAPALRRKTHWRSYYPTRMVRLYVPVVASVVVALALAVLVPRTSIGPNNPWMHQHNSPITLLSTVKDLTLISPGWMNSPLWSLRWEVVFSLLLPAYVFIAARTARAWWLVAILSILASTVGLAIDQRWLTFLPMFMIGSALAAGWDQLERIPRSAWGWAGMAGLFTITARWWVLPNASGIEVFTLPIVLASALVVVAAASRWHRAQHVLSGGSAQWLGRTSYSLYLVHEPLIVSIALLLPVGFGWLTPALGIPVALVVAWAFARSVERPSHRLAKAIGRLTSPRSVTALS